MSGAPELRVVAVEDEREPLAREALELISESIGDVQPVDDLLSEIEECRRGMATGGDYHLVATVDGDGRPVAAAAGIWLEAVNAGFITYLAVHADMRGMFLGRELRAHLVDAIRQEARRKRGADPAYVVGEVKRQSPWLRTLVSAGEAIPFAFPYFHPWMPRRSEGRYVLYREPMADPRPELSADEVVRLVYAIWRRAYRIRFPLQSDTFCYMVQYLEEHGVIGTHPDFAGEPD
ncbi:GNAT family N-acetyltransferase [Longimicrobium sp.]|uniref:GNAT family N-acetyltransferase n=1 Tax=Longimicrobium sp. TaxID=2029185 RepID=UPI002E33F17B|nr:GNAT family N-acetyltransferase [Longimicrobium sp.]HEX6039052.1 GNAT family N-acetyltransferase [Longimicrobium sp.]